MDYSEIQKQTKPSANQKDSITPKSYTVNNSTKNDEVNLHNLFGNIISVGSSEIIVRIIAFFGIGIIARRLGSEGFGVISFALAIFSFFSLVVTAGFNDTGTREIIARPAKAADITANIILVRLTLALGTFCAIFLAVSLISGNLLLKTIIVLTNLKLFSLALDTSWAHKGLGRGHRISIALILEQLLSVGLILLIVRSYEDIIYVPLAQLLGELVANLFLLTPLFRFKEINLKLVKGFSTLRQSGFWTVSRLVRTLTYTFDVFLIGVFFSEREVGLYTAPYRIVILIIVLSATFQTIYLPAVVSEYNKSIDRAVTAVERLINLSGIMIIPLIIGGTVTARSLIEGLFGIDYLDGTAPFRLILVSAGLIFLHGTTHNLMLAGNRTKAEMKIFVFAAIANVTLNLLITPYLGLLGAAAITVLTEMIALIMMLYILNKDGIRLNFFRPLLKPVIASLLMAVVLTAFNYNQMLVWRLTIGAVSYIIFLYLLGGFPQEVKIYLRGATAAIRSYVSKFYKN